MPLPAFEERAGGRPSIGETPEEIAPPPSIRGGDGPMKPVVTGTAMVGMLWGIDHWARPLLKVTGRQRRSGLLGWLDWTLAQITRFINPGVNAISHELSKAALHRAAAPAGFLNLYAWRWAQLNAILAHFAAETAYGFERIVHHKTPRQIRGRTRPLEIRVKRLRVGEIRLSLRLHRLDQWLRQRFAPRVLARLHRLDRQAFQRLPLEVGKVRTRLRRVEQTQQHDHSLLRRIGWIAPFAGAVPLVLYAFRRMRLGFLRCVNTRSAGQRVCGMDRGLLNSLLADTLLIGGTISIVAFARELQALEGEATALIGGFIRDK